MEEINSDICGRKILRRIFGPGYENDLGWRLKTSLHCELFELLDGPDTVGYIKFRIVKWISHVIRMDNTRIPKKGTERNISWKKTFRKTNAEITRQCHKGALMLLMTGNSGGEVLGEARQGTVLPAELLRMKMGYCVVY